MNVDLAFIGTSIGFGGIAGFLIAYAVKKAIKIMLFIIGLLFAALAYLNYRGILTINWDKLTTSASGATTSLGNATGQVAGILIMLLRRYSILAVLLQGALQRHLCLVS